jgi:2-methylcitrate dehydratase PrpD
MDKVIVNQTQAEMNRFELAIDARYRSSMKTAEALRKVILLDTKEYRRTELGDFPKGQVDPQMQLLLIARNEFLTAEDPTTKLGFYKSMRDIHQTINKNTMEVMDMAMKERHHRDKLELLAKAANANEPTAAEVEAAMGGDE